MRLRGDLITACKCPSGDKISGSTWHFLLLDSSTARSTGVKLYQFPLEMRNPFYQWRLSIVVKISRSIVSSPAFDTFKSRLAIFNWVLSLSKNLHSYFIHPRFTETCNLLFLTVNQIVSNASGLCCTTPDPTLFMTKVDGIFWVFSVYLT